MRIVNCLDYDNIIKTWLRSTASMMRRKVEGEEEITAPDEEEAEQVQCLPIPDTPTSVMRWQIALLITPTDLGIPIVSRDEVVSSGILHTSPERAEVDLPCRSTIAS